jgi:hypothetical protein
LAVWRKALPYRRFYISPHWAAQPRTVSHCTDFQAFGTEGRRVDPCWDYRFSGFCNAERSPNDVSSLTVAGHQIIGAIVRHLRRLRLAIA